MIYTDFIDQWSDFFHTNEPSAKLGIGTKVYQVRKHFQYGKRLWYHWFFHQSEVIGFNYNGAIINDYPAYPTINSTSQTGKIDEQGRTSFAFEGLERGLHESYPNNRYFILTPDAEAHILAHEKARKEYKAIEDFVDCTEFTHADKKAIFELLNPLNHD
jgi:hypothetical protein